MGTDPLGRVRTRKSGSTTLGIEYHTDGNALRDSLLVGDRILALGSAGNLLVFDHASFSLLGERHARRSFVCIGPGDEAGVYAGLSNGAIVGVNPADLSLTEVGEVAGRPEWIGRRKAGVLVAISNPSRASYGASAGRGFAHKLRDLGTGREYPLDAPTTFFLDSGTVFGWAAIAMTTGPGCRLSILRRAPSRRSRPRADGTGCRASAR